MAEHLAGREQRTVASPFAVQGTFSRRISWGALFAGVVVAAVVQMMLSILGVSVGAASIDAQGRATAGVGIGAGIWLAISSILAFFCAGWTSGRLAGIPRAIESTMHGVLSWALTMVIGTFIFTSALSGLVGGAASLLGQTAGNAAGSADPAAVSSSLEQVADQVRAAVDQQGGPQAMAAQVQQTGAAAADNVAGAALAGFVFMLLGAVAAALGGFVSRPKNSILTTLPAWDRRVSR